MPNAPRPGTLRASYMENTPTFRALKLLATAKATSVSDLIREATAEYIERQDPSHELQRLATTLANTQGDTTGARVAEELDAATLRRIAEFLKKFRES